MEFVDRFRIPHAEPREGPLTWGQIAHYNHLAKNDDTAGVGTITGWELSIREELSVESALSALRELIGRHETLRTSYSFPEPEPTYLMARGQVRQSVSAMGALSVLTEDLPLAEMDAFSRQVRDRFDRVPFDIKDSRTVRVALMCQAQRVRRIVLWVSHQAVDGWGLRVLWGELLHLTGPAAPGPLPVARHPVDQAGVEATARYQDKSRKATGYLRQVLTAAQSAQITLGPNETSRRGERAEITSAAVSESLRRLSDLLGISPATSLMACTALLTAGYQDSSDGLLKVTFARRHTLCGDIYIAPNCLTALVPFNADRDRSMHEYVTSGFRATLRAYQMCDYHPDVLGLLELSVGAQRSHDLDGFCYFNYTPTSEHSRAVTDRGGATLGSLVAETTITSADRPVPMPANTRMQTICHAVGPDHARIAINAVAGFLPHGPSVFLRRLEQLLMHASEGTKKVGDALTAVLTTT